MKIEFHFPDSTSSNEIFLLEDLINNAQIENLYFDEFLQRPASDGDMSLGDIYGILLTAIAGASPVIIYKLISLINNNMKLRYEQTIKIKVSSPNGKTCEVEMKGDFDEKKLTQQIIETLQK